MPYPTTRFPRRRSCRRLLLALWRWACRDLVGPVIGHVAADLAL